MIAANSVSVASTDTNVTSRTARVGRSGEVEAFRLLERIDVDAGEALYRSRAEVDAAYVARGGRKEGGGEGGGAGEDSRVQTGGIDWPSVRATLDVARVMGGKLPVVYFRPIDAEGYGRLRARVDVEGSSARLLPYVYMYREIRAPLAAAHYWDVDFANCQPSLLRQRLREAGIDRPLLDRYVDRRDEGLKDVSACCGVDRDAAKSLFIRLVYGGGIAAWAKDHEVHPETVPGWVRGLASEVAATSAALIARPEFEDLRAYTARFGKREVAQVVAVHLQTLEARCVSALVAAVRGSRRSVGGIIFDGVHVERVPGDGGSGPPAELLDAWTRQVRAEGGYDLELTVKAFAPFTGGDSVAVGSDADAAAAAERAEWLDGSRMIPYSIAKALWERNVFKVVEHGTYAQVSGGGLSERRMYSDHGLNDSFKHLRFADVKEAAASPRSAASSAASSAAASTAAGSASAIVLKPFISRWVVDPQIRKYDALVLAPPPRGVPAGSFNIWSPFAAAQPQQPEHAQTSTEGTRAADAAELTDFVHVLFGRNRSMTDYVLDWLAQTFQSPGVKTGIALVLKGEEGVGKNRFTDLVRLVVGADKVLQTADPANVLYGRFTRLREGKLVIVVNEASGADSFAKNDVIKDMITCDQFISEGKGTNSYPMSCFARLIFTTNNSNCVRVSSDCRRYVIAEVSSELKGNTAYFKRLSELIDSPTTRSDFFASLVARDVSRVDWINDRPITQHYVSMIQQGLAPEYRFIKSVVLEAAAAVAAVVADAAHAFPAAPAAGRTHRESVASLFARFKLWLVDTSSSTRPVYEITKERFGTRISELIAPPDAPLPPGSQKMRGISKAKTRVGIDYVFKLDVLLSEMVRTKWLLLEDLGGHAPAVMFVTGEFS